VAQPKIKIPKNSIDDFLDAVDKIVALREKAEEEERLRLQEEEEAERNKWELDVHQIPPQDNEWLTWLLLCGRGVGKTFACAYYVDGYARRNPDARIGIIAVNQQEAVDVCVNGESGLKKFNKDIKVRVEVGGTHIRWPNGAQARVFGASTIEEVDKIRGQNFSLVWADEIAAWKQLEYAWQMFSFALRINLANKDEWPRCIASTTPRKIKFLKELLARSTTRRSVPMSTLEAKNIPEARRKAFLEEYGGTRIGRQELDGELLDDVEGALWKTEWIDEHRIRFIGSEEEVHKKFKELVENCERIVVAVDPAVTARKISDREAKTKSDPDDTAICVAGKGRDGDYYVFDVYGIKVSPKEWAEKVIEEYDKWEADKIIAESNNGGDLVELNLKMVRRDAPVKLVHAFRGKDLRAEPIATLYEKGRVHHVGSFAEAEDQMTAFPVEKSMNDDMVDAIVYAITELQGRGGYGIRFI